MGTCVLLLNAGHEATVNSTVIGWWTLFRHPDRLKALREDRSLLPSAIEELLRFDTPLQMFERWVLEPFELHGQEIPKGAELGLIFGSANRDERVFDEPDVLDIARDPNPHLTFGMGIHFCLGAPLGRLELQTSFASCSTVSRASSSSRSPHGSPGTWSAASTGSASEPERAART